MFVIPAIFFFLLGCIVGSHVNVLVLRFGFSEKGSPRSECAQCGERIRWYDLIPVVSYFALGGRCRTCGSGISRQYPLVEFTTGALFLLAYLLHAPALSLFPVLGFLALLTFIACAVGIVAYDIRHTLIPLPFVYVLAAAAIVSRGSEAFAASSFAPLIDSVLGALVLGGFFAGISFLSRERGMGMGDGYVAAAAGLLLGISKGIAGVILGVWIATAFYLLLMLGNRMRLWGPQGGVTMKTELPFAPWLILGSFISLFSPVKLPW